MKRSAWIFLGVVFLLHSKSAGGLLLDLFGEKDRHGISIRVEVSDTECSTFPVSWSSKAASVNTLGSCVQLYDEPLCKGALTIIQPFHTIHQMDLSLINFAERVQSASACGPKVKSGRFVLQNAADASVLTVSSKYGGFARAFTVNASTLISKAQQWDVVELSNSEYSLKPREFGDNYPVSYDEESLKQGKIVKKLWKLMSVGRGRYLIKSEKAQRCLYKTEQSKVEEHDCRVWSPNQEWVLKEIFGNPKTSKNGGSIASRGPGYNFNVLSKVASYIPPSKPLPEFVPIFINASTLATMKRKKATPAPYTIQKKIRRGPRPVSKPTPALLSYIRPPGLRERPALANKVANNNKFLLLKNPQKNVKEFVPSDDRVETYAYYQQVLLAEKEREELIKKGKRPIEIPKLPPFPPSNRDKKKVTIGTSSDDDEENDDDDDQEEDDDSSTEKKTITITIRRKKKKDKEAQEDEDKSEDDQNSEEDDSDEEDKPKKKKKPPPPRPKPPQFNPYDINFVNFDHTNQSHTAVLQDDELNSSFLQSVFYKVKSLVPGVPFLSSSKDEDNKDAATTGQQPSSHQQQHPHLMRPSSPQHEGSEHHNYGPPPPPRRHKYEQRPEHDLGPPPRGHKHRPDQDDYELQYGPPPGLRLPKRKSSTTTTTEKSGLLSFLG